MRGLWQRVVAAIGRLLNVPVGWERKEDPMRTLYHRPLPPRLQVNWLALILGPFWYFLRGMWVHGFILLTLAFLSAGLLVPLIWLYAGLKANEDLLDARIMRRSYY